MINNSQRGVSLYITFMIMTVLLVISLGVSSLLISQLKMLRRMGGSVNALYAADTGIEKLLYNIYYKRKLEDATENWDSEYGYVANIVICSENTCLRSKGEYEGIFRAFQSEIPGIISPLITNCSIPSSGSIGDTLTIEVDISGLDGVVNPQAVIERPRGTQVALVSLSFVTGSEITYRGLWDTTGFSEGDYSVVIQAQDGQGHSNELYCGIISLVE